MGVCRGQISQEEYDGGPRRRRSTSSRGGGAQSVELLTRRMNECAEKLRVREGRPAAGPHPGHQPDQRVSRRWSSPRSPTRTSSRSRAASRTPAPSVLKFREERLVDKQDFLLGAADDLDGGAAGIPAALLHHPARTCPKQVQLDGEIEDIEICSRSCFSEQAGPQGGDPCAPAGRAAASLWRWPRTNAAAAPVPEGAAHRPGGRGARRAGAAAGAVDSRPPTSRPTTSPTSASDTVVGGMVVFENGRPNTQPATASSRSRRSQAHRRLRQHDGDAFPPVRPLSRGRNKDRTRAFGRLPDLILLDGGKGHVGDDRAGARRRWALSMPGVRHGQGRPAPHPGHRRDGRRDRDHRHTAAPSPWSSTIQDEVHRFSITFSRARHQKIGV